MSRPDPVKIYHITHVDNLVPIIGADRIYLGGCRDGEAEQRVSTIGMSKLKQNRFEPPSI